MHSTNSRWWQLKYFLFSPLLGEMIPILTNIFQRGWFNHQPVLYMGVSKNNGTPKWMVYKGKPGLKMDDLGENQLFLETPIYWKCF